jgi:hypothetical protein
VSRTLRAVACALLCCGFAAEARADWLISPFLARSFGGTTLPLDLQGGAEAQHWMLGASGGWLGQGLFGVEGEFTFAPGFFERPARTGLMNATFPPPVNGSHLSTVMGNVLIAVPAAVTRESLRPYAVAGLGIMSPYIGDPVYPVNNNLLGLNLGGGAIGLLSRRTGIRFDLRHVKSIRGNAETLTGIDERARLSYWRASVGLILRY